MSTSFANANAAVPTIRRERKPGLDLTVVHRAGVREYHLTLQPMPGERTSVMLWRLDTLLREHRAVVVKHDIFGAVSCYDETMGRVQRLFGQLDWPVTWIEGSAGEGKPIGGMHVFAISGAPVETVSLEGRIVGRVFNDGLARHCILGDVRPAELGVEPADQARQLFENIEAALDRAGMKMPDLIRTWLFLDDILEWYGPFNVVRKEFFESRRLFDHLVPASTGVGGQNPACAAIIGGAWAMQPIENRTQVSEVISPLQCPAPKYGSCFSRAVEVTTPGHRRLLISGTASLEFSGKSAKRDDIKGQIERTMDVVEAILTSRNLSYAAASRATAYFKRIEDVPAFNAWCAARNLSIPVVSIQADVCRDELLFELELDAMVPARVRRPAA